MNCCYAYSSPPLCATAGPWGLAGPMNPLEYAATRAEWRSPFLDIYASLSEKPWLKWCFKSNNICNGRLQRGFACFADSLKLCSYSLRLYSFVF